jgi:peptide/nickel transport system substrate-binding protein
MDETGYGRFLDGWSRREFLRRTGLGAMAAAGGGVLLEACGNSAGGAAPATPRRGGHVAYGSPADPRTYTSVLIGDSVSGTVASLLNDSLLTLDAAGAPQPLLAESVPKPSGDGLTVQFTLRDARWTDGQPVTAGDVAFTYGLLIDPANAGVNSVFASQLQAHVESVTAVDQRTVTFRMKQPYAPFITLYCAGPQFGILPGHVLGGLSPQAFNSSDYNANPTVTNGMFKFVKWDRGTQVILARNEGYHRGPAHLDQFVLRVVSGGTVAIADQLRTGELDLGPVDFSQVDSLASAGGLEVLSVETAGFTYYVHQLDPAKPASKLFSDKQVRHALLLALDRQGMVDAILFKQGSVADSVVPRFLWAHNASVQPRYGFDRAAAERTLDAAGWTKGPDGVRARGGTRFEFELLAPAGVKYLSDTASAMQDQWRRIGVMATPRTADLATVFAPTFYDTRSFDMLLTGIGLGGEPDIESSLWSTKAAVPGGANAAPMKDPQLDQLLSDAAGTFDQARRKQLYDQVQDIVMDFLPGAPLFFQKSLLGVSKRVEGVRFSALGGLAYFKDVWVTDGK